MHQLSKRSYGVKIPRLKGSNLNHKGSKWEQGSWDGAASSNPAATESGENPKLSHRGPERIAGRSPFWCVMIPIVCIWSQQDLSQTSCFTTEVYLIANRPAQQSDSVGSIAGGLTLTAENSNTIPVGGNSGKVSDS